MKKAGDSPNLIAARAQALLNEAGNDVGMIVILTRIGGQIEIKHNNADKLCPPHVALAAAVAFYNTLYPNHQYESPQPANDKPANP